MSLQLTNQTIIKKWHIMAVLNIGKNVTLVMFNSSIGTNDTFLFVILSAKMFLFKVESQMLGQVTQDQVNKCSMMDINRQPILIFHKLQQRQCQINTNKKELISNISKWMQEQWISHKTHLMLLQIRELLILLLYIFNFIGDQCGEGSNTNANKMLSQIYRVLSANGVYIMITFGSRENRLQYLEKAQFDWGIKVHELPKPTVTATITQSDPQKPQKNNHFVYVCTKGKKTQPSSEPQPPVQQQKK